MLNKIILGDCLQVMKDIPDKSIDAIITDPPYGTTACKWDSVIPFEPMWKQLNRIIKPNGAIVLFGNEPFSSALRMSNIKNYKYDWIWEKERPTNFQCLKKQVGKVHEIISVFYDKQCKYYPIMSESWLSKKRPNVSHKKYNVGKELNVLKHTNMKAINSIKFNGKVIYPRSVIKINRNHKNLGLHPTQKPVSLIEYLIRTYTLENETVLDFTIGSGTTAIACINTGRNFIGIEKDLQYYDIANKRIKDTLEQQTTAATRHGLEYL